MTRFTHLVYALSYLLAGLAAGLGVPLAYPGIGAAVAVLSGSVVILAGGLVHEVVTRLNQERTNALRLRGLRQAVDELTEQVNRTRADLATLRGRTASTSSPGLSELPNAGIAVEAISAEADLRRSLVGRLGTRPAGPRPPVSPARRAGNGVSPAAPAAPEQSPAESAIPEPPGIDDGAVLDALRDALQNDRIDVYLQPVVSLPQRKHRHYEVFSRLRAADGKYLMPDQYLEIAERAGLISTIDNLLLMRCIELIRATQERRHNIGFIANISSATLNDAAFMKHFLQIVAQQQHQLRPKLVFELGQADLLAGGSAVLGILDRLGRLGFRFSIDQVRDLDIDVADLVSHEFHFIKVGCSRLLDPAEAEHVGALRRRLDGQPVDLIAEKVETEAQLAQLLERHIDFGQGFLFGEPRLSRRSS